MDMLLSYHITPHKVTPASTMSTAHCRCSDCWESGAVRGAEARERKKKTTKKPTTFCFSNMSGFTLPDYVIVVPQVKFLLVLPGVVHNSHTRDKIDDFLGGGVVQVVAALMSPVSVHPLQSQVAVGSSPVSHLSLSVCLSDAVT